tara:strand:+ start:1508 stop:3070 length:1563 start_codon:yes stop_codon:yes gene_type:complete
VNNKFYYLLIFIFSFIYPTGQSIMSYEMKAAEGQGNSKNYFENFLDINYFFDNGLYLFSQIEYSNPPLLGLKTDGLSGMINIFYLQYSNDKYDLNLGNLYLLYGRGLSMHTYQDEDIDYDNSLIGFDFTYHLNDNIDVFTFAGIKNIKSRLNPENTEADISIDNEVLSIGGIANFSSFSMHYLSMINNQLYNYNDIIKLAELSNLLGKYLASRENYLNLYQPDYEMLNLEHNLGIDFTIKSMDFYLEKSLVYYDKILSERVDGYKNYLSTYFNIFDFNIIYEYKDYFTPYLYNTFSTPPIAFRESTSILSSRNLHAIDFSNEYGYQFEINKTYNNSLNILLSYAYASHHQYFDNDLDVYLLNEHPYKQFYLETSKWDKTGKFYYRLGYDYYRENSIEKNYFIKAYTIPMQYAYNFKKGNSLTFYIEFQDKINEVDNSKEKLYYFSPSYNYYGKWLFTIFIDGERGDDNWLAMDYTLNLENSSQISLFYGSQKGGLVCANGSCVIQPDFEDGFKITYRASL